MSLPSSGQISFNDVRIETSQSIAPNYQMGDWTSGAFISASFAYNTFAPVNLRSVETVLGVTSASRFNPYLNNDLSDWYSYNHYDAMSSELFYTGDYLYTHTGINHCCPSTMIPVDIGTTNKIVYISISGSADYVYENVYVFYGKPWDSNGNSSNNSSRLITASGHFYPPYSGDVNLEFGWDYRYTASLGQYIYFVIYGEYCVPT